MEMESDFHHWIRNRLPQSPSLWLGPGDDAAILRLGETECVVTTDLLTDQVDFCLGKHSPRRIGRKALAVNLSDLAAMAAQPLAGVVALALPQEGGFQLAVELYEGLLPLAEQYGVAIAGGDLNSWDNPLVVSITLIGQLAGCKPLYRDGAREADAIIVTGEFGGSILGKHFDFDPRIEEARFLAQNYEIHGAIDCSDGLSLDLSRMAEESGLGAVIDPTKVPIAPAAYERADSLGLGSNPLDHALGDGEDFELIMAVPPEDAKRMLADQPLDVELTAVGRFIEKLGLWKVVNGQLKQLQPKGFSHRFD